MADDKAPVDDQQDRDGQADESNDVEARLAKLEKLQKSYSETLRALDEEKKASAGKDKKITELSQTKKELQEGSLSKDKLLEIRQKELDEAKAEWEQKAAAERIELEKLRIEQLKTKVISRLENFPSFLIDRVRGTNEDEIEADARNIMKMWVKERDKVENVRKLGPRPKSGGGKQISGASAEDVKNMTPRERMEWAAKAGDDEFAAAFDELHTE